MLFSFIKGEYSEYLRMSDQDNIGVDGFLSPSPTKVCRTFAADSHQTPTFLGPIAGEGMEGTREITG